MDGSGELFATCAGAGATIVAIFAGFLITRYLTLSGEIEGAKNLVDDLTGRVALELADAAKAERDLVNWDICWEFSDYSFVEALLASVRPLSPNATTVVSARGYLDLDRFDDQRLQAEVDRWVAEAVAAEANAIWALIPKRQKYAEWSMFREANKLVPEIDYIWSVRYDEECEKKRIWSPTVMSIRPALSTGNYAQKKEPYERRRDVAREALENAEAELHIATLQAERLGRPGRLMSGLVVLVAVFILSVVPSILLLAPTPASLSRAQSAVLVGAFFIGVALLFGYLMLFALRLTRGTGINART